MLCEVTVEDPEVLLQPWVLNPMLRTIAGGGPPGGGGGGGGFGGAGLIGSERGACQEEELDDISNQIRH
jgi:hypothetical protein